MPSISSISSTPPRQIFVTTALPYANGPFHIGHIMEYIQADIWVRYQRLRGHTVYFMGADDTHGAPIMIAAEQAGKTPSQFARDITASRAEYLNGFLISFDHWYTTDSPENIELSQEIYRHLKSVNLIDIRTVEQYFDPVKQMFLPDRYVKGECPSCGMADQYGDSCEHCGAVYTPTELRKPYSVLSGAAPIRKESEHYFFRLSDPRCVSFLKQWLEAGHLQIQVTNKAREWLSGDKGLADWDISRDAPYFGIPIPDAPGKYFYVWLDAPIGYLASFKNYCAETGLDFDAILKHPSTEQVHFIGKDIIYFHTLFWPALLHFSERKTPDQIYVHGFITVSGSKMSKSRGTGISPLHYLKINMNPEWLRYYLAAKLNAEVEDMDFNPDDFMGRINSDLVGKLINLAARSSKFITEHFDGRLSAIGDQDWLSPDTLPSYWVKRIGELYEQREYAKAVREIMSIADEANQYFDAQKPWIKIKDADQRATVQHTASLCLAYFRLLASLLAPILPRLAAQSAEFLNDHILHWDTVINYLPANHPIKPYSHLMQRVSPEMMERLFNP